MYLQKIWKIMWPTTYANIVYKYIKLQIQRNTAFLNLVGRFVTSLIARLVGDGTVKRPQTSRHMSYVPFIRSHVMEYTLLAGQDSSIGDLVPKKDKEWTKRG